MAVGAPIYWGLAVQYVEGKREKKDIPMLYIEFLLRIILKQSVGVKC